MDLALRYRETSNSSKTIPLKSGLTIGRRTGDIIIKDPKLSGQHCIIYKEDNDWIMKDLKSVNGIYYFDRKVTTLILTPGTEFQLGKTTFKVVETGSTEAATNIIQNETNVSSIESLLKSLKKSVKNTNKTLFHFSQPVQLIVTQGLNYGSFIDLYYGPRFIGKSCIEFDFWEQDIPEKAFVILNNKDGKPMIRVLDSNTVLNNDSKVPEKTIVSGDKILMKNVEITIKLLS